MPRLIDSMIVDGLWDVYNNYHMGTTAENIARQYGITRREQDEFAAASQQKAEAAQTGRSLQGRNRPGRDRQSRRAPCASRWTSTFAPEPPPRRWRELKPAFSKDGTVTAGNASGPERRRGGRHHDLGPQGA